VAGERLLVRARVTERGRKSFELTTLFGTIAPEEGGGALEAEIPAGRSRSCCSGLAATHRRRLQRGVREGRRRRGALTVRRSMAHAPAHPELPRSAPQTRAWDWPLGLGEQEK
jgi:hypothetical protein